MHTYTSFYTSRKSFPSRRRQNLVYDLKACPHCRRKVWLLAAEFGDCRRCFAVFCGSLTFLWQCGQGLTVRSVECELYVERKLRPPIHFKILSASDIYTIRPPNTGLTIHRPFANFLYGVYMCQKLWKLIESRHSYCNKLWCSFLAHPV